MNYVGVVYYKKGKGSFSMGEKGFFDLVKNEEYDSITFRKAIQ